MTDSLNILELLVQNKVHFVVIGGFAAFAHGSTLLTLDVDICCDFRLPNLFRLQQALAGVNPMHRLTNRKVPFVVTPQFAEGLKNLYLTTDAGVLDCLGHVKGIGDYREVCKRSESTRLPFGSCRVLTIDALIESKKAMGRPKDNETVLQLTEILNKRQRKRKAQ